MNCFDSATAAYVANIIVGFTMTIVAVVILIVYLNRINKDE